MAYDNRLTILRRLRLLQGWGLVEFSKQHGFRYQELCDIERRRYVPSVRIRERLAEIFGVPSDVLFEESGLARLDSIK